MNDNRPKIKNHVLENVLSSIRNVINDRDASSSPDMGRIHKLVNPDISEKTKVRMELMREYSKDYHLMLQVLDDLTQL